MNSLTSYRILLLLGFAKFSSCEEYANISVSSYHVSVEQDGAHNCSGVIIDERYVLTVAQCAPAKGLKVRAGSSLKNEGGTLHEVVGSPIVHEEYKDYTVYDVALLRVEPPFKWDQNHTKIKLFDQDFRGNLRGAVTGWDLNRKQKIDPKLKIEKVTRSLSKEDCLGRRKVTEVLHDKLICGDFQLRKPCSGDFGASLVVKVGNETRLAGLTTIIASCSSPIHVNLYTEIAPLINWINSKIKP